AQHRRRPLPAGAHRPRGTGLRPRPARAAPAVVVPDQRRLLRAAGRPAGVHRSRRRFRDHPGVAAGRGGAVRAGRAGHRLAAGARPVRRLRVTAGILAAAVLAGGCAGPHRPLSVGVRKFPGNVLYGDTASAPAAPAPVPPTAFALPAPAAFAPVIPGPTAPARPAAPTTTAPTAPPRSTPPPACPTADPRTPPRL